MGLFDKIGEAPVFEFGVYLPPGFDGEVQFDTMQVKPTFNKGDMFIVEFTLITSNLAEHPPGSKRSNCIKMIDPTTALPSIKQMFFGAFGIDHNDAAKCAPVNARLPVLMNRATSAENIMAGIRAHLVTKAITTKKGTLFTRHMWGPPAQPGPTFDAVFSMPSRLAVAPPPAAAVNWAPPPPPPPPAAAVMYDPSGRYQLDPRTNTWIPRT